MMILALVLGLALQQPPAKPSTQSTRKPAPPPAATLELKVTDRKGAPIVGAEVAIEGPSPREGETDANGSIVFRNMTAGAYRGRVERDGFITLEKEATVRAGTPFLVEFALSAAPPAAPAPKPQPAPAPPPSALAAGLARALAIDDALLRSRLPGREPVERLSVGCSGATASEVLRLRDGLEGHTHADGDEVLYIVAGEGTLTLGSQDVKVGPGWYSLVPRGIAHALVRSGRNPIVLLSVLSGQPCPSAALAP